MEKIINQKENLDWKIIFNSSNYPLWMKLLSLSIIIQFLTVIYALLFWDISPNIQISAFGLSTNNPRSLLGVFIISVLLLNVFSSFAILFEKKNAIIITKLNVVIGFTICLVSMFVLPIFLKDYSFIPRFEILILALIYKTLKEIEVRN